jgi:hypothetical protein
MRLVQGRWYYCGNNKRELSFPTYWHDHTVGMELGRGRWHLLELTREERFVRARTKEPGERVAGTFRVTTFGAFVARIKYDFVPSGPVSPELVNELVLAIPQPKDGVTYPVTPILTKSPRTLTINHARFVAIEGR